MMPHAARLLAFLLAAGLAAGPLAASARQSAATTRLHRCGDETCLLIAGHRASAAAPVFVAAHAVAVSGGRSWRVMLPLRTVRQWSAPAARAIAVTVAGEDGGEVQASLPIGLLGHVTELAFLDVSARR